MTPQSHFMVLAAIAPERETGLRTLLAGMNRAPGVVDAMNATLPFASFGQLHFMRLVILDGSTAEDITAYGLPRPDVPKYLALMGDCDGPARQCLEALADRADAGLRRLFTHCADFNPASDLLAWMLAHDAPLAAAYVNTVGRTVTQVRQESALQRALSAQLPRGPAAESLDPQAMRRRLVEHVRAEQAAGRLQLTPPAPTPLDWWLREAAHAVALPLVGVATLPLSLVALPFFAWQLRRHERSDPDLAKQPAAAAVRVLQRLEDHDVTNQFTAMGMVKPGRFRRWTLTALLALLDYACRHVYHRGHLTRVQTIHFARWAFLDDKTRLVFASNYDGSLESYMDDFINKVAWGLNLVFSNGVGYPPSDWLVCRGARIEQRFKDYLRRHELPTEVWYKAYPGLTAVDLARNQRIREGLERATMSDAEAIAWLRLL